MEVGQVDTPCRTQRLHRQRGAFARQGLDLRMVNVGDPNQAAQQLLDTGTISQYEFEILKAKALDG